MVRSDWSKIKFPAQIPNLIKDSGGGNSKSKKNFAYDFRNNALQEKFQIVFEALVHVFRVFAVLTPSVFIPSLQW